MTFKPINRDPSLNKFHCQLICHIFIVTAAAAILNSGAVQLKYERSMEHRHPDVQYSILDFKRNPF